MIPVNLMKSNDGDIFMIKSDEKAEFIRICEAMEDCVENSEEHYSLMDEFDGNFGNSLIEGNLHDIQFFIKEEQIKYYDLESA